MPIPVLSVSQMREWEEATWSAGVAEKTVMRRAGKALADVIEDSTRPGDFVLFLAGKGHNGDDTAFAREQLEGRSTEFLRVTDPAPALPQIEAMLARKPALVVDGLFGIGLNRALSPEWIRLIEKINSAARPVLAVDLPSGLDADTGLTHGAAICASCTLTFGAAKTGLLKTAAAPFVGRLEIAPDIGLVPCPFSGELVTVDGEDFQDYPPRRIVSGHKGTFGHVAILSGSRGFHGAAVLAARGAQRAQPGLITLHVPESIYTPVASQLQAVMVHPYSSAPQFPENATTLLIGPGLAAPELNLVSFVNDQWKNSPRALIVDASALDWLQPGTINNTAPRVITPHPGEAARLLGVNNADVQANRPAALRALSKKFGLCWVMLKGHQTLVGRASGEVSLNLSGNPHLAQGGSGDLLAGYAAGLLAQTSLCADLPKALRYAVWQHGAAADQLLATNRNFTIEDIATTLGCTGAN